MIPTHHTGSDVHLCARQGLGDKSWGIKNFVVVGEEEGLHPMLVWFVHLVTNYILYIEGLWDVLPAPSCLHPQEF